MLTVSLKPDMAEQIKWLAGEAQTPPEVIVDKALRLYLTDSRREKTRAESEAFEKQRPELLARYRGEYVAVHEGQVVDHDSSLRTLHLRVFARLGHTRCCSSG